MRGRAVGPAPVLALALTLLGAASVRAAVVRLAVTTPSASWEETHVWSEHEWTVEVGVRRVTIDLDGGVMRVSPRAAGAPDARTLSDVRRSAERAGRTGRRIARRAPPGARDAPIVVASNPAFRFTLRRAGAAETIAGVRAVPYRIESPILVGEVWIARALPLPDAATEWLALAVDVAGVRIAGSKLAAAIARLGGFPVRLALAAPDGAAWSATAVSVAPAEPGA